MPNEKILDLDKAIMNCDESNIEMAKLLNPIIAEYRLNSKIDESRGQCYNECDNFVYWLQDNKPELYSELEELGLNRIEGSFQIDYPEKLPLTLQDLNTEEYKNFLDLYEKDVDLHDEEDTSHYIWKYIKENLQDKIHHYYSYNHAWLFVDGLIIDFTWEQFKNAIDDKENILFRYDSRT